MIEVRALSKIFRVHERAGGLAESMRTFFRRTYRDVSAVNNVTFSIAPGEIVGFLGPNGAGKTTTLKMLSGLLHPSSGEVKVAGFTPKRREREFLSSITMVMGQKQQLLWDLPPEDTFLLNKEIYAVSDSDYRKRLERLDQLLSLGDLMTRQTRKLSLGERMKCELAAALLHQPQVLFLDEPTIGLDVNMQQSLRDFIAEYNRETGATILLTSHYMADVTALCERVIVINQGKVIFDGDLGAIVNKMSLDKAVKLKLFESVDRRKLERFGRVEMAEGYEAELRIPRGDVAEAASRILGELPVADIAIEDTPIEAVIGQFMEGKSSA